MVATKYWSMQLKDQSFWWVPKSTGPWIKSWKYKQNQAIRSLEHPDIMPHCLSRSFVRKTQRSINNSNLDEIHSISVLCNSVARGANLRNVPLMAAFFFHVQISHNYFFQREKHKVHYGNRQVIIGALHGTKWRWRIPLLPIVYYVWCGLLSDTEPKSLAMFLVYFPENPSFFIINKWNSLWLINTSVCSCAQFSWPWFTWLWP